jgi:hypothetical protein
MKSQLAWQVTCITGGCQCTWPRGDPAAEEGDGRNIDEWEEK